jgi:hypothetical protein
MMNLDQQLQLLIENAPQDGVTPIVMKQAVTPVLKLFANQLQHVEYFVCQTLEKHWVLTTLSNRTQPNLEKKVIYAFTKLQDAANFHKNSQDQLITVAIPVTHILFQLFAMNQIDSIVFMEIPGNLKYGQEVHCQDVKKSIETQLQKFQKNHRPIPPNLA